MKKFSLAFAAAACVIAAPAVAGSIANSDVKLAQVDVHIGDRDRDHDRDRDRHVVMNHDRDHCRFTTLRENHDGRIVIRREKHCD
jgi:hypothetical protein